MTIQDTRRNGPAVQSASRALAILVAVAESPDGATARELAERLGLRRPTLYHLLQTLEWDSFLERGADRRYRLGLRIGTLADSFARQLTPPESLLVILRDLAHATSEAAYLVARRGGEIILVAGIPSRHGIAAAAPPIGRLPDAHARASGKVALAFAPREEREDYLRRNPPVARTPHTIVDREELERQFEQIRADGYATNIEESEPGVCVLAAPLDRGGSPYVLSLSAPRDRFEANHDAYLRALLDAAAAASTKLVGTA